MLEAMARQQRAVSILPNTGMFLMAEMVPLGMEF